MGYYTVSPETFLNNIEDIEFELNDDIDENDDDD